MDQSKTGSFLKELRKEKGLTQEQLAERFHVAGRTVSRWENGYNMPDLSTLVELADFYDVDIRELIDGERKSETMNEEMKETLEKVVDYTDAEKRKILNRLTDNMIGAAVVFLVLYVILLLSMMGKLEVGMISIILTLIGIGMSGSGVMTILQMKANLSRNWMHKWQKRVFFGGLIVIVVCAVCVGGILIGIFDMQYNSKFVSRYLSISINDNTLTKVGESFEIPVYIYNISMPELGTVSAERILLDDALRSQKVSMQDLCKHPREVDHSSKDGLEITSYSFENYRIVYGNNKYVIVPLKLTEEEIFSLME